MYKTYLKLAFRNLSKNKVFSIINILGLTISLTACILIALYVTNELSYDRYNVNADRIYRINADYHLNGTVFNERVTPAPMAGVLQSECPGIEGVTRINGEGQILVRKGMQTLPEPNCYFADPSVFKVFTLHMLAGDPNTALNKPNSIVITDSIANKYFNSTNVIGKTLHINNTTDYMITGVIKTMPVQSHLHFNFLKSMTEMQSSRDGNWWSNNFVTYLLAKPGVSEQTLNSYLTIIAKKYLEPTAKRNIHADFNTMARNGDYLKFTLLPLTKIHLYSTIAHEAEPGGNIQYVYMFIIIAVFILLVACINFMNLSTAQSAGRSKEVGVRKVLGSGRSALIYQFLTEALLTSGLALVAALVVVALALPYVNSITALRLTFSTIGLSRGLPVLVLVALVVGLAAGSYPAFFLSAFEPIKVLKGKLATGFKSSWLRNSLVVFQFITAISLIIGVLVIYNQLSYIRNKNIGYNRRQILVIQNTAALYTHAKTFKAEVQNLPGVEAGTMTPYLPTGEFDDTTPYGADATMSADKTYGMLAWPVDADYIPTLGMKIVKGRNFSPGMPTDSQALVINESAARTLGFADPVGKKLYTGSPEGHLIIGVVKDFNFGSMHHAIVPLVLGLHDVRDKMAFRIHSNNIPALIEQIKNKYYAMDSKMAGQPFVYSFMDDDFNRIYQSDLRTGHLFTCFALMAIAIACLGLFGLAAYAAEQRTKEIGIRKVLGASVTQIFGMLSNEFVKLIIIAAFIAFPLAWWGMSHWLEDFAYRTPIHWWVFVTAAASVLIIALGVISFRVLKAALINPASSLRSE